MLGGKGIASQKRLPGPFNHNWAEGLMEVSIKLLNDKFFCTAQVRVLHRTFMQHAALRETQTVRTGPGSMARVYTGPVHSSSTDPICLQVLVPFLGACASLSAACLFAVWVCISA